MLRKIIKWLNFLLVSITIFLIKLYQLFLSPLIGNGCRFYPTCSCYSNDVFKLYGFIAGVMLTLRRLSKCHPFNEGGEDLPTEGWRYIPKWMTIAHSHREPNTTNKRT